MNTMHYKDAAKILGINGNITPEIVKAAYRSACSTYHPDRNPAGLEMMQSVNLAYATLKDSTQTIEIDDSVINYGEDLNAALSAIINLQGLVIELCGAWVWVSGDTKTHKATLKEAGYKWASKKLMWYFRPSDFRSFSRGKASMDDIRASYGSRSVRGQAQPRLAR